MIENELISIIIPVYNAENYITNTIQALQAQTYKNLEVIFVNDGSSDNTEKVCMEQIKDDNRFCIYTKENSGPSATRNYGLNFAKGTYLAFIDGDDYIYPDYIKYLYELIKKYDADMANCEYYKLLDTQTPPVFNADVKEMVFNRTEALQKMYCKTYLTGYPCLKLFKREMIQDIRFPEDINYAEDIVFVDKVLKKCRKVAYGNRILYLYYQHASSITHKIDSERLKKSWKYHENYFEKNMKSEMPELEDAVLCKQFVMAMDLSCRVWKADSVFRKELTAYIKKVDAQVFRNKENKRFHRLLAFLCCVSATGTIRMCMIYNMLQAKFKIQKHKAV